MYKIPYILKDDHNILTITCIINTMLFKISREICWSIKYIYIFFFTKSNIKLINSA